MGFAGPLFLVGMPRSGTKLLRELLNRHPRIAIPPAETEFLPYLVRCIERFGDLSDFSRFERFHKHIGGSSYFQYRQDYGPPLSARAWYAKCRDFTAAGIFEALVRIDVEAPVDSDIVWGDKSPSYIDDLTLISRLYPSAKFIHLIRDVRGYCLSINAAWSKNMLRASQRWVDDVERARDVGRTLGATTYTELRYEDLLRDPTNALLRLCDFLGVEFDASMTLLERPTENLGNAKGEARIVADNFGEYRKRMPRGVLIEIEAIAGETLLACGYELAAPVQPRRRMPEWRMRAAQLRDGWNLLQSKRDRFGWLANVKHSLRYFSITRAGRR